MPKLDKDEEARRAEIMSTPMWRLHDALVNVSVEAMNTTSIDLAGVLVKATRAKLEEDAADYRRMYLHERQQWMRSNEAGGDVRMADALDRANVAEERLLQFVDAITLRNLIGREERAHRKASEAAQRAAETRRARASE